MPDDHEHEWIKQHYDPPYAIHNMKGLVDWTSRGSDISITETSPERSVQLDTVRYGVLVKFGEARGAIAETDYTVILKNVVNWKVLCTYPFIFMYVAVFYLQGYRSGYYRKGQRK